MAKRSKAPMNLEKTVTEKLNLMGVSAFRHNRACDYSESVHDITLLDHPRYKLDCKYKKAGWSHHSKVKEVHSKYCGPDDVPVVVTKSGKQRGEFVTIPLEAFAELLRGGQR